MRKSTWKRLILIVLAVFVLAAIGAVLIPYLVRTSKEQSGQEWFLAQERYLDEIQILSDSMDDVYTLYFSDSMTKTDFHEYLLLFQNMNAVLQADYQKQLIDHPVSASSYTYHQKSGCEYVKKLMADIDLFLADSLKHETDIDYLIYSYATFGDTVADDVAGYQAAKLLNDLEG